MCEELLVTGPKSKFAPSERQRFGFGTYRYIGLTKFMKDDSPEDKRGAPVYMLAQNTSSRIGLITRLRGGFWAGWVSYYNPKLHGQNVFRIYLRFINEL